MWDTDKEGIEKQTQLGGDDRTNECCMQRSESKNKTYNIHWEFEMKTNHQIPDKRPDLVLISKTKIICQLADFYLITGHKLKVLGPC